MKVLKKLTRLLKQATYNNSKDERLFVYRDVNRKWLGISINVGHPQAYRYLLSRVGLVALIILLTSVFDGHPFLCFVLAEVFCVLFSWESKRAFDVAEQGVVVRNDRSNESGQSVGVLKSYQSGDFVFLLINLAIILIPLIFAVVICVNDFRYWIFISCLAMFTLYHMTILILNFLENRRGD